MGPLYETNIVQILRKEKKNCILINLSCNRKEMKTGRASVRDRLAENECKPVDRCSI